MLICYPLLKLNGLPVLYFDQNSFFFLKLMGSLEGWLGTVSSQFFFMVNCLYTI